MSLLCSSKSRKLMVFFAFCLTLIKVFHFEIYSANMFNNRGLRTFRPVIHYVVQPTSVDCLKPTKLIIVIKSTIDEFEERQAVRRTWAVQASQMGVFYFFSIGSSKNPKITEMAFNESTLYGDVLQTTVNENFNNKIFQTYSNYRWLVYSCNAKADGYFFTESDVIVFLKHLLEISNQMKHISGVILCHCWLTGVKVSRYDSSTKLPPVTDWPNDTYPPHCSGVGYYTTGDVPQVIMNSLPHTFSNKLWSYKNRLIDDVMFTGVLRKRTNIIIQHTKHVHLNRRPSLRDVCNSKTIAAHGYRQPSMLVYYWEKYMEKMKICSEVN